MNYYLKRIALMPAVAIVFGCIGLLAAMFPTIAFVSMGLFLCYMMGDLIIGIYELNKMQEKE